jgi:c-di-GMP-related signal transduction protein
MQKSLYSLIITGLLVIAPANTNTLTRAESSENSTSNETKQLLTKNELYFGLSKPAGLKISEIEWQQFVNTVITPRFKEGLTVIDANGQYLNNAGTLTREKTKVVILIHDNNPTKNKMIQEVILSYKQKFQQESVLQVTSDVKVSF